MPTPARDDPAFTAGAMAHAAASTRDVVADVSVHLVSRPVRGNLADATRTVGNVGFCVVRLRTKTGHEGIGVTYHEVGGEATKLLIETDIAPQIVGRDPFATEAIFEELRTFLRGVGRKGLAFGALSAVDLALWDLKGKILGMPLWRLLGGTRTEIPVYASGGWTSYDDDALVDEMKGMVARGYSTIKFKVGVEGGRNIRRDAVRVGKVREAVGAEVRLLVDANNAFDAATAVQLANRIREFDVFAFEEPVPADDIPGLSRFRRGTDIPLATGEHEYTRFGVRDLILAEAADIVQADIARVGGVTEMLKIIALTEAFNLKFAPHAMEHMHMHLLSAVPNALFLERLALFEEVTAATFRDAPVPVNGVITLPDAPGLGLTLDEDAIADAV